MRKLRHSEKGYGMIVIAVLLVAFMAVTAAFLDSNVVNTQIERQKRANDQLHALSRALILYSLANNGRYPCPAQYSLLYTNGSFGSPYTNCATTVPLGGMDLLTGVVGVVRGMVPVRALAPYGISLEDAFDPWGTRIMYVVGRQLTPLGSGVQSGRPTLTDYATGVSFVQPDYLLVSYGKDQYGGVYRSQTGSEPLSSPAACPNASTVTREENCDKDAVFLRGPWNIFADVDSSAYFDDIIVSYAAGQDCVSPATVSWSSGHCSYSFAFTLPSGATYTVPNTAASYVGSATVTCNSGSYVISSPHCAATGAACTWTQYYDTWPSTGTADCTQIHGWSTATDCTASPCSGTGVSAGTSSTYATAAASCTNATCRYGTTSTGSPSCFVNRNGTGNTVSALMYNCRP